MIIPMILYILAIALLVFAIIHAGWCMSKDITNTNIDKELKILYICGELFIMICSTAMSIIFIMKIITVVS